MLIPEKNSAIIDELTERIRSYYLSFNVGAYTNLQAFIDVDLLESFKDTALLVQMLDALRKLHGRINVQEVAMDVHLGEKSRDYAIGKTRWKDSEGRLHYFNEHWVRSDRGMWFTRNLTPKC